MGITYRSSILVIVWYISASERYVNTAAWPPGILTPCPEHSHPATQERFLRNDPWNIYLPQQAVLSTENDDPPPPYTEYERMSRQFTNACPANYTSQWKPRQKYFTQQAAASKRHVPRLIRHNEDPVHKTSNKRPRHQYLMRMQHVPPIIRQMEEPVHNASHNRPRHQYVMRMQ